ncbi:hypothetical protein GCM10022218_35160 [Sphingobacterium ginsenosidimutans]|uniref:Alpha/beta hydrolase n=1 Tax=Sphingobacterium ginsenosidimutans TaxID=687845 RepID=A0ABP8AAI8_9SPHI
MEKGGHFAVWEQPERFTKEMKNAFRSLRSNLHNKTTFLTKKNKKNEQASNFNDRSANDILRLFQRPDFP